jgi:hypothetical protein
VAIKSAKAPDAPSSLGMLIVNQDLLILWTPAADNYDAVTRFEVALLTKAGTWQQSTLTCDGADPKILLQNECSVPLATLQNT